MAETTESVTAAAEDAASSAAATKRYESLVAIRTRAINGKGAWYWAHLEPMLATNEMGVPKAAKIRCSLCDSVFSASNPSRTASEHLKRGSCPSFVSSNPSSSSPKPISSAPPLESPSRKRSQKQLQQQRHHHQPQPLSSPPLLLQCSQQYHVVLSGGKEDLGALAMLEDSVKRLKSPNSVPNTPLPKPQADSALALFADWLLESCGHVTYSSLRHPKLRDFLSQVGLPPVSPRHLLGPQLDSRYRTAAADSDAKVRDALFFQLASTGWKDQFVSVAANLPNGTAVFRRTILSSNTVPPNYAQELLSDAVNSASAGITERCVGIVSDHYRSKALRNLETQNQWMVNLSCQVHGILSLVKDFARELPIFETVASNCLKLANFFNNHSQARTIFHKCQLQVFDHTRLLRAPPHLGDTISNFGPVYSMLEDITECMNPLRMSVLDVDYKVVCMEEMAGRELGEMVQDVRFWNELDAVRSLVKLVKDMAREAEMEKPLVGQCLPLWNELKSKLKNWGGKFGMDRGNVEGVMERRFNKNYHPAWSAAFILDPLYLVKDACGKYLPPFKLLSAEQEKDVDRLITRMVSREEGHIVLMELMKWRTEGLDPLYAKAVQVKQPDPITGKMRIANPQSRRLVWETCLSELKLLRKVAVRLIFLHATAWCGFKTDPPVLRWVGDHRLSRTALERAQKLLFVAAHAKLERRSFSTGEGKDAEIFDEWEDNAVEEAFTDAPSV